MDTLSLWKDISIKTTNHSPLTADLEVDVVIVGGGITGITAANELMKKGKKVAIVEAGSIGGGTTGFSTGNLYIAVQPFYQHISSKFNFETAKAIAHSRKLAIDYIEENIIKKNINCHFMRRSWYAYTEKNPRISIENEVELMKRMDIAVDYTDALPIPVKFKKAIIMPNQARFNPLQYVISMAEDLVARGCLIFENTRVDEIKEKDICTVITKEAKITAKKVLIATHTPIGVNPIQFYTAPYRSYVVAVHLKDNNYPEGHFWDLDEKSHATCTHSVSSQSPQLLMVAGSHHKTGQGRAMHIHYQALEKFLREHFDVSNTAYQWSAQHYQSADNVPYIGLAGRFKKHTYMATGYFADGLVYGTIAGILISDLMQDKHTDLDNVYQSNRFKPIASAPFLIKEGSNVFLQYLKDYPLTKHDYSDVKKGEGKVVEINREKCAVSRDENNQLHIVSAVCTHMKCIVNWNDAEKTWDCPCHGSRFTQTGKVIEGPAIMVLETKKPT